MTARRTAYLGLLLCLGLAQVAPAMAEDPVVRTQSLKTTIIEDVVDGVGGILGVLVGPPISSPTPYLEGKIPEAPAEPPAKETAAPVNVAVPAPVPLPPPAPVPPVATPAALPPPVPAPPAALAPPPVVKSVTAPPPASPPPRPSAPVAGASVAPVAPAVAPAPSCSTRVAATATLEQMRRLPRCP